MIPSLHTGDLDANRPVPFRLTPNIAEFLTPTGVMGPLTAAMISAARCLVQPQYKLPSFLRTILRDEYISWHKKVSLRFSNGNSREIECRDSRFPGKGLTGNRGTLALP